MIVEFFAAGRSFVHCEDKTENEIMKIMRVNNARKNNKSCVLFSRVIFGVCHLSDVSPASMFRRRIFYGEKSLRDTLRGCLFKNKLVKKSS